MATLENISANEPIEILDNAHYVARPVTLDFTNVVTTVNGVKVVKSGTPIKYTASGWVASNDGNATRILYGDVYEDAPVGSGLVHGFVNKAKAQQASGLTYDASVSISQITLM